MDSRKRQFWEWSRCEFGHIRGLRWIFREPEALLCSFHSQSFFNNLINLSFFKHEMIGMNPKMWFPSLQFSYQFASEILMWLELHYSWDEFLLEYNDELKWFWFELKSHCILLTKNLDNEEQLLEKEKGKRKMGSFSSILSSNENFVTSWIVCGLMSPTSSLVCQKINIILLYSISNLTYIRITRP